MNDNPQPMTVKEAAAAIGITVASVRKAIERRRLVAGRFGTTVTIDVAEVERYRRENAGRIGNPAWKAPE